MMKVCSKCMVEKDMNEYYLNTNGKPLSYCKDCRKEQMKKRKASISNNSNKTTTKTKKCSNCGLEKDVAEFYKNKHHFDGLTDECKDCSKQRTITVADKYSSGELKYHVVASKICVKCGAEKPIECFNKNKRKHDGRSTECKDCVNEYNKMYREAHKEEAAAYNRQYREDNKEILKIKKKAHTAEHKVEAAIRAHNWYEENKELTKERTRAAKKNNPQQYQNYSSRRRAKKRGAVVEKFDKDDIINTYGDKCFYCGGKFEHIDHYVPLSKGGAHTLENVRPACGKCNLMKNNKDPEKWMEFLKKIGENYE